MPLPAAQKNAIEDIIRTLTTTTSRRAKRTLADMFLDLVDNQSWPEYYKVIPQPRCINGIKSNLAQNKYKNPLDAFEDLSLVFLNALHYNEESSQIAKDASTLKGILENEWRQNSLLPAPPNSPPASAAQNVHASKAQKERAAAAPPPAKPHPASASKPPPKAPASAPGMNADHTLPRLAPQHKHKHYLSPKSPDRPPSPDLDVDVGGTPEPEATAQDTARDGESEEIVRQLEKGLPRWEGFAHLGWAENLAPDRIAEMLVTLSKYRDENGNRLASSLESVPEETNIPDLSFNSPLSLRLIESRTRMRYYVSSQAFDKEMSQLFLKARRWYDAGTDAYGNVLVLQRFYQALTSANPPLPPYHSATRFAALPAGPGTATPLHSSEGETGTGVTTFRVSGRDRKIVDEVKYKGWSVRLADWLHLSNPDDPSRPIVGQVFRCFVSEEPQRKGQLGVSVCWYYRPEQTLHPAERHFWEKEVFKTSHFADHPLEDVIEKIACQFTARHLRGRPRPPFWYPGWPLYVCDSRYNDRERVFVKIKNWNSCIPEEVRKKEEFMPIYPFERSVIPRQVPSPFVANPKLKAPGGILEAAAAGGEKTAAEGGGEAKPDSSGSTTRKRPKRAAATKADADRVALVKSGQAGNSGTAAQQQQQPAASSSAQAQHAAAVVPSFPKEDHSIVAAAGGLAALGSQATMEELPPETARHFDRDPETNEVLWFAAPPVDIVHTPPPQHSLKYLAFLARKRKGASAQADAEGMEERAMDVDGEQSDGAVPKRRRMPLTATETLEALLEEHGL